MSIEAQNAEREAPFVPSVYQLARQCYEEAGRDVNAASALMSGRVRDDFNLMRALLDPLIDGACREAVRGVMRRMRSRTWKDPAIVALNGHAKAAARKKRDIARAPMTFQLPGGMFLRDATGEQVMEAARKLLGTADTMAAEGRWLHMVAVGTKPGKTVQEAFTEEQLRALKQRAERVSS